MPMSMQCPTRRKMPPSFSMAVAVLAVIVSSHFISLTHAAQADVMDGDCVQIQSDWKFCAGFHGLYVDTTLSSGNVSVLVRRPPNSDGEPWSQIVQDNMKDFFDVTQVRMANGNDTYPQTFKQSFDCPLYTHYNRRFLISVWCTELVAASRSKCSQTAAQFKPLCLDTCNTYAASTAESLKNSTQCPGNSAKRAGGAAEATALCKRPEFSGASGSCVSGDQIEGQTCGYIPVSRVCDMQLCPQARSTCLSRNQALINDNAPPVSNAGNVRQGQDGMGTLIIIIVGAVTGALFLLVLGVYVWRRRALSRRFSTGPPKSSTAISNGGAGKDSQQMPFSSANASPMGQLPPPTFQQERRGSQFSMAQQPALRPLDFSSGEPPLASPHQGQPVDQALRPPTFLSWSRDDQSQPHPGGPMPGPIYGAANSGSSDSPRTMQGSPLQAQQQESSQSFHNMNNTDGLSLPPGKQPSPIMPPPPGPGMQGLHSPTFTLPSETLPDLLPQKQASSQSNAASRLSKRVSSLHGDKRSSLAELAQATFRFEDQLPMPAGISSSQPPPGPFSEAPGQAPVGNIIEYNRPKQFRAIRGYAPTMADEMELVPGDVISINQVWDDGWAYGLNLTTGQAGALPISFAQELESEIDDLLTLPSRSSQYGNLTQLEQFKAEVAASRDMAGQNSPKSPLMGGLPQFPDALAPALPSPVKSPPMTGPPQLPNPLSPARIDQSRVSVSGAKGLIRETFIRDDEDSMVGPAAPPGATYGGVANYARSAPFQQPQRTLNRQTGDTVDIDMLVDVLSQISTAEKAPGMFNDLQLNPSEFRGFQTADQKASARQSLIGGIQRERISVDPTERGSVRFSYSQLIGALNDAPANADTDSRADAVLSQYQFPDTTRPLSTLSDLNRLETMLSKEEEMLRSMRK